MIRKTASHAVVAACLALTVTAAQAEPLVVIEARGGGYQPGQTVADSSAPLTLRDGELLVLVASSGQIIRLRGPVTQAPLAGNGGQTADVAAALSSLVTQKMARTDKAGVVRGQAGQAVPPDPWLLDVTRSGRRCQLPGRPLTLWRGEAASSSQITLMPSDRSWVAQLPIAAGRDRVSLPDTVPVPQRAGFTARLDGKDVALMILAVPAALTTDMMRVAWMTEMGCDGQALALLKQAAPTLAAP